MKKVIEQVDKFGNVSFQVGRDGISLIQIADGTTNWVIIEKSKAKKAALAICPELEYKLAEKDKEIERLKRRKLVHQLFIGKVSDILSIEKVQELLKESNESLNK